VISPEVAEEVVSSGNADVVGIARALIADGKFIEKAREGRSIDIRPCIGCNECISRRYVENLGFACAVNPAAGHEFEGPLPSLPRSKDVLVIGGGPAGMEFASRVREGGFNVRLWEAADSLGGQLRWAVRAPKFEDYRRYLDWQRTRLEEVGVEVTFNKIATAEEIIAADPGIVVIATGAHPHRPAIAGVDLPNVVDIRDVLDETVVPGKNVVIVAQDDHIAPLSVADFLAERGHQVTLVYATNAPAQLLGRYIVGGILGRLDAAGVDVRNMEQVVGITPTSVRVMNVYSQIEREITNVDTVVLACGGVSNSSLYEELKNELPEVHILGDAYAPRRLVFATRMAYALADNLVRTK
jgi:NADPH-dependent 2,4-dienoyl-CoA reductase/sulfur reductase-like enzyme